MSALPRSPFAEVISSQTIPLLSKSGLKPAKESEVHDRGWGGGKETFI